MSDSAGAGTGTGTAGLAAASQHPQPSAARLLPELALEPAFVGAGIWPSNFPHSYKRITTTENWITYRLGCYTRHLGQLGLGHLSHSIGM